MARGIDYAIPVLFVGAALLLTGWLLSFGLESNLVTSLVVVPLVAAAFLLERLRPERPDFVPLDQPFRTDLAHFVLNYELGYVLAAVACGALGELLTASGWPRLWPSQAPWLLQLLLAALLGECVAYWQHRLAHRWPRYWRFHALHHSGDHLNLVRVVRFHFVDVGPAAFAAIAPLVLLGAPDAMIAFYLSLTAAFGLLGHANMRMRTPAWLSWLVCTPAVHRHHHARAAHDSDGNFGTMVMLFDIVFGTFRPPASVGPSEVGIEGDPQPQGFWPQMMAPFRDSHVRPDRAG
jgi:sterol desaturase/sphingolipid hydroxylase (fatty acid hydroxylase superfamily)